MAGNSQRRGAMRKTGTKKGMVVGSGGQRRKSLKGKGPTPKATERPGHPAARRARAAAKRTEGNAPRSRARSDSRKDTRDVLMGRNPVVEAMRAGVPASALYVLQSIDVDDRVREALSLAGDSGLTILESSRTELDRLCGDGVHQGLALTVPAYRYADPLELLAGALDAGEQPLLVALDGVTDPRNLGAVVRSAAAFGAHGVIVPERRSAGVTGAVWKASAGALSRLPVAKATNLTRTLQSLQREGCLVVGLAAEADVSLTALDADLARGPIVIVVGSEGRGLGRLVGETCELRAAIPMVEGNESLNAAVAAGIALYAVASARVS